MAFIQGRARAETMRAEDVLHDLGAISMIGSDSQGVGRAAESAQRSFQLGRGQQGRFGRLPEDGVGNDNFRIKRYLAKVTINPAITFGVDTYVGSIAPGKLADMVLWRPNSSSPSRKAVKGGFITHAAMGDPAGSLMTCQPLKYRPQYGYFGANPARTSYSFVTKAAIDAGLGGFANIRR